MKNRVDQLIKAMTVGAGVVSLILFIVFKLL
jgi:hypothetical protein